MNKYKINKTKRFLRKNRESKVNPYIKSNQKIKRVENPNFNSPMYDKIEEIKQISILIFIITLIVLFFMKPKLSDVSKEWNSLVSEGVITDKVVYFENGGYYIDSRDLLDSQKLGLSGKINIQDLWKHYFNNGLLVSYRDATLPEMRKIYEAAMKPTEPYNDFYKLFEFPLSKNQYRIVFIHNAKDFFLKEMNSDKDNSEEVKNHSMFDNKYSNFILEMCFRIAIICRLIQWFIFGNIPLKV